MLTKTRYTLIYLKEHIRWVNNCTIVYILYLSEEHLPVKNAFITEYRDLAFKRDMTIESYCPILIKLYSKQAFLRKFLEVQSEIISYLGKKLIKVCFLISYSKYSCHEREELKVHAFTMAEIIYSFLNYFIFGV